MSLPLLKRRGPSPPRGDLAHRWLARKGITEAGIGVSQWNDQVGTSHMTQSTDANRPVLTTYAGNQALYFNGAKYLDIPDTVTLDFQNCSVFVCYQAGLTRSAADGTMFEFVNSTPNYFSMFLDATAGLPGKFATFNGADKVSAISVGEDCVQVFGTVCDAAGTTIYNGSESELMDPNVAKTLDSASRLGASVLGAWPLRGYVIEVLIYSSTLDTATTNAVLDYFSAEYGAVSRNESLFLGIEGDSHSARDIADAVRWPLAFAGDLLTAPKMVNDAVDGEETDDMRAQTTLATEVAAHAAYSSRVAMFYGGTNDLLISSRASADVITDIDAIVADMYTDGFTHVYACTIFACGGITGADETSRLAINAHIKTTLTCDGYIDFAADARLQDPNDTTYYDGDTVHLTTAGYQVMAVLLRSKLASEGHI